MAADDPVHVTSLSSTSSSMFSMLPDDLLWDFLLHISTAAAITDVAHLSCADKQMHAVLQPAAVARHRLPTVPWRDKVTTLEQLAVWEALEAIACHRVTFEGAATEIRDESQPVVAAYANLLGRFPSLKLSIHAHVGRHAPPSFALSFTRERAEEVASRLEYDHGIEPERISSRGWGKAVALHAGWPAGRESARGELFVECHGLLLPPLPSHYHGVEPDQAEEARMLALLLQDMDDHGGTSDDDEMLVDESDGAFGDSDGDHDTEP